jgi:acyl dehydratase
MAAMAARKIVSKSPAAAGFFSMAVSMAFWATGRG